MSDNPGGGSGTAVGTPPPQSAETQQPTSPQSTSSQNPPSTTGQAQPTPTANLQDTAAQAAGQVKEQAGQALEQAQQVASQVVDQARSQIYSKVEEQKNAAADTFGSVAGALRKAGDHLREENQGNLGGYLDQAAGQVDRFSSYFRDSRVDDLIGEAEDLARREPALFLGGAILLGVLASRFLKSSSVEARRARYSQYSGYTASEGDLSPYIRRTGYAESMSNGS